MSQRRTLVIGYAVGATGPREILRGLRGLADPLFVVPPDVLETEVGALLQVLGPVVPWGEAADTAARVRRHADPDGVLTFSERMLPRCADLAVELGARFHSPDTVRLLVDKDAQRRALRAAGVPSAASVRIRDTSEYAAALAATSGPPVVVKPTVGEGSRNTFLVEDAGQGEALVAGLLGVEESLQVEELLVGVPRAPFGDYVSVESLVEDGRVRHLGITGKLPLAEPFREVGQFWPSLLDEADRESAEAVAETSIRALGIRHGLTHVELKLTETGPRVLEVNGRMGGFVNDLAQRAAGVDLVAVAAGAAMGDPLPTMPRVTDSAVWFQYNDLAPVDAVRLVDVAGAETVAAMPGIDSYRAVIRPGSAIEPGVGTQELDLICGHAADADAMFDLLHEALAALSFRLERPGAPGGPPVAVEGVAACDLPSAAVLRDPTAP